ncbi:hypothetical protein SAMN04488052_107125 [Aquisalimonas asiatica]|uniref:Copper resistance protein D n=2 Tax=Aquisalimonas asiatica TaxID=406100 RepID=A0A1H8UNS6_9GAMM|nr:hypothetical protein SAMN04488052_107125 [Aquisalimonas asiatica]
MLVYPLVNAGHILGVALLVGSVLPLDLRLAGLWPQVRLVPVWRMLSRTAASGFLLALLTGLLLFATRATEYVESMLFLAKLALILAAGLNAAWLARRFRTLLGPSPAVVRPAAVASIFAWVGVLVLGRLVGYF